MATSKLVRSEVVRRYPPDMAAEILRLFETTDLPMLEGPTRDRDRVQLAVLLYAGQDMQRLREIFELATIDWRDVLMAAGIGGGNWADVLRKAGFPVP